MEIRPKFNLNQTVYILVSRYDDPSKCPACRAHGYIRLRTGQIAPCGLCYGQKTVPASVIISAAEPLVVESITANIDATGCQFMYNLQDVYESTRYPEDRLFATLEEAHAYANSMEKLARDKTFDGAQSDDEVEEADDYDPLQATQVLVKVLLWNKYNAEDAETQIREVLYARNGLAGYEVVAVENAYGDQDVILTSSSL